MAFNKVKKYLERQQIANKILVLNESCETVNDAAKALNIDPDSIAKTLSFVLKNGTIILIVTSGTTRIDNQKFRNVFNERGYMVRRSDVEKCVGHAPGAVCPFAVNEGIKIYLDESLKKQSIVYPSCGKNNSAIALTIAELEKYSNYEAWINVGKIKAKI